ncbi:MAG: ORF6N domain-containing protein [Leptospirales bacterium]|nr:ORF6N domain-containing protein [Leptospirales bacterium]
MNDIIQSNQVENLIITIRNERVLLDSDVAMLYGVETREINQAVKNNPDKFPDGYILSLSNDEKNEVIKNFDNLKKLKFSPTSIKAFTEKGLYMLATILKSHKATQTTIAIVETFAKIREFSKTLHQLPDVQEENRQKALMQRGGEILTEILDDNVLELSGDETTIEVNLAVMKIKHTIKREKRARK